MTKEFEILKKELENLKGKIFIGMVHTTLYGPLRNLNFILQDPDPVQLDNWLSKGHTQIQLEVWKETMLSTVPMVLPWEMSFTSEITPKIFNSIKEAEDYIRKKLKENKNKSSDPFYYRLGTH